MFKSRKERTVRRTLQNAYDIFSLYEEYTGNRLKGMNPLLQILLMFHLLEVSIDKVIHYINTSIESFDAIDLDFFVYFLQLRNSDKNCIHFEFKNGKAVCMKGA